MVYINLSENELMALQLEESYNEYLDGAYDDDLVPATKDEMRFLTDSLLFKHPLENSWTLWHWASDRYKSWAEMISEVTSFDTVEDFWSVYYFVKLPSEMKLYNDYMLFKQGIRPLWEDEHNKNGGRWVILVAKFPRNLVDRIWHDLLLHMVGETFEFYDEICGAVVNIRHTANKISLWTKNAYNTAAVLAIGRRLKAILPIQGFSLQYQVHKDCMVLHGPSVSPIYSL